MKVSGDWLTHPGTQALCAALAAAGHRALIVGGAVRNSILGEPVADVDIATAARPDTVIRLAEAAGFKVAPTGIEHGTVTVIAHGKAHEVTTFRRDIETDGRRAVVAFSDRIEEDARRRDLTMNALYADAGGEVIDPLGGLPDTLARRVRFVGNPETRIREDYLRILRFFRFHAAYGDPATELDAEGLAACAALADGLSQVSRERVGGEMRKLLAAPDPAPAVAAMSRSGVLEQVLPAADTRALAPLIHLEGTLPPRWLRRLAVLGGNTESLRLSRLEAAQLVRIRDHIGLAYGPAPLGWLLGAGLAEDTFLCRAAILETHLPAGWREAIDRGARATFPVTSADLMPALQGAELGARLKHLQERWIRSDLSLDRIGLLQGSDD